MKSKVTTAITTALFAVSSSPVFANGATTVAISGDDFPINDLGLFISRLGSAAIVVAAILVFIYLIWGGVQWITSGGDKGKTEEARARITAALVGLAIVAAAWAVMTLISNFFGLNLSSLEIKPAN